MPGTKTIPLETSAIDMFVELGVIADRKQIPSHLQLFALQADLVLEKVRGLIVAGRLEAGRGVEFQQLVVDACMGVLCHPIVASNNYLQRFSQGVSEAQARHEIQQFSVFAHQFDVAQTKLVANAPTEEAYEERLKVLLNEKGIPYKDGFEGELTGQWNLTTVHFTWLRRMSKGLGLKFEEIGKIWVGLPGTVAFVDATFNNYASIDQNVACGSSFAIENWAANSLWKPWIAGMEKLNAQRDVPIDLGYLTYHDSEEEHHSQATLDELLENFIEPWFDSSVFLDSAEKMLDVGVQAYYVSQLESLPEKDDTWPATAYEPRALEPADLPRIATAPVTA